MGKRPKYLTKEDTQMAYKKILNNTHRSSRFGTLTVSDAIEGVEHQELSHTAGRCNNVGDSRGVSYKANISLP